MVVSKSLSILPTNAVSQVNGPWMLSACGKINTHVSLTLTVSKSGHLLMLLVPCNLELTVVSKRLKPKKEMRLGNNILMKNIYLSMDGWFTKVEVTFCSIA